MIHIVFEQNNVEILQKSIELDTTLQGQIIEIKDDYAVGPIKDIFIEEGYNNRLAWWENVLQLSPYINTLGSFDDRTTVEEIKQQLNNNSEEEIWIWMGQNQHDVCSYYWLISQLKDYQGRIEILYLNNLPFINEKGNIFYPIHLYEIQPKEFLKAKKLARLITPSEFEIDSDEWNKLCEENATVRILEGGKKIVGKEESFYDKDLLNNVTADFQKVNKILHNTLAKMKIQTGDAFLAWRINELAKKEKVEIKGNWNKGWKELEVKLSISTSVNS